MAGLDIATSAAHCSAAGVETLIFQPPGFDVELRVSIAQPARPAIGAMPARLPVVYVTDGDFFFGTTVDAARIGAVGGEVLPAVIVGIGYADEAGDHQFTNKRRFVDFYRGPRRSFDAGPYGLFEFGGADAFLAVLRDHIIPLVEGRVPAIDPGHRVLLGCSAGGHFATHAMIGAPGLFRSFGLTSPVLSDPEPETAGEGLLVPLVAALPDGAFAPEARVFLSAGSLEEDPGTMFAFLAILSNAYRLRTVLAAKGVATDLVQFAGETHGSVGGAAISRAVRFLLPVPN